MTTVARHHRAAATDLAKSHPHLVRVGQIGWLVKGVVYLVAGLLAVLVVVRSYRPDIVRTDAEEASPTGAINEVANVFGGRLLLVVLATGLMVYALWRLVTVVLPGGSGAEAMAVRAGYLVSALIYGSFSLTALSLARDPEVRADGNEKVTAISARLLASTAGRFALGAAGLVAVGAGVYRVLNGFRGDVTKELDLGGMSRLRLAVTKQLAVAGEVGRGVAIGLIGVFLARAAKDGNAQQATGLDGALRRMTRVEWGRVVVAVIAVGFVLYGMFCVETFHRRELEAP